MRLSARERLCWAIGKDRRRLRMKTRGDWRRMDERE